MTDYKQQALEALDWIEDIMDAQTYTQGEHKKKCLLIRARIIGDNPDATHPIQTTETPRTPTDNMDLACDLLQQADIQISKAAKACRENDQSGALGALIQVTAIQQRARRNTRNLISTLNQTRTSINENTHTAIESDAISCVCCGCPSETATEDGADMCWPCMAGFLGEEYACLKRRAEQLAKALYPQATDEDMAELLDEMRPLPARPDVPKETVRYKLQVGKWGMYIHDTAEGRDIDMEQVCDRLNAAVTAAPEAANDKPISAHVSMFLAERCLFSKVSTISAGKLYDAYFRWAKENDYDPLGKTRFFQMLKDEGRKITRISRVDGGYYRGITLRTITEN